MKKTVIESKYAIGDKAWCMSGRQIPRHVEILGFSFYQLDEFGDPVFEYITTGAERRESELFETEELLLKRHSAIMPHKAILLLKQHARRPIRWLTDSDITYLQKRSGEYNPAKVTRRDKEFPPE